MAFTVEDGTIVLDANAYIDESFFRGWHADRGNAAAAVSSGDYEPVKVKAAIIKATDYVDKRFGNLFTGYKRSANDSDQSLQWPRLDAFDTGGNYIRSDEIPRALKRAVAEYALLALKLTNLLPVPAPSFNSVNPDTGETSLAQGGMLQREKIKVGPVEEEKWYNQEQWRLVLNNRASGQMSDMTSMVNLPEYPVADEWLRTIIKTGNNMTLSRG
jgi:hypothetical protein